MGAILRWRGVPESCSVVEWKLSLYQRRGRTEVCVFIWMGEGLTACVGAWCRKIQTTLSLHLLQHPIYLYNNSTLLPHPLQHLYLSVLNNKSYDNNNIYNSFPPFDLLFSSSTSSSLHSHDDINNNI